MHELNEGEIDLETSWQNFDYNAVGPWILGETVSLTRGGSVSQCEN